MNEEQKPTKHIFETYLSMVRNSVGAKTWQTVWATVDGTKRDVTEGGVLSCAFFVSSILKNFDYSTHVHATVASTVKDLKESGWQVVDKLQAGAVVVYAAVVFEDGTSNEHIAICVDDTQAISNSYSKRVPVQHPIELEFDGKPRTITEILYKPGIEKA